LKRIASFAHLFNFKKKIDGRRTTIASDDEESNHSNSIGELMWKDAEKVRLGFEDPKKLLDCEGSLGAVSANSSSNVDKDEVFDLAATQAEEETYNMINNQDFRQLSQGLQERADKLSSAQLLPASITSSFVKERRQSVSDQSEFSDSMSLQEDASTIDSMSERRRSSLDRIANKQLVRLYNRRAFTAGLVFSRGHFLGDISKNGCWSPFI
jgi:hypothetical protein